MRRHSLLQYVQILQMLQVLGTGRLYSGNWKVLESHGACNTLPLRFVPPPMWVLGYSISPWKKSQFDGRYSEIDSS
jgi:hypothetical protein